MPKDDDTTDQPMISSTRAEVRILRANNVEIPLSADPLQPRLNDPEHAEYLKLRSSFFAGEKLTPEQLNKVMLRSLESGGGNGNCNLC